MGTIVTDRISVADGLFMGPIQPVPLTGPALVGALWQDGMPAFGITGPELRGIVAATLAGSVGGYAFGHGIVKGGLVGLTGGVIAAKVR